jgi:hypothetical protein
VDDIILLCYAFKVYVDDIIFPFCALVSLGGSLAGPAHYLTPSAHLHALFILFASNLLFSDKLVISHSHDPHAKNI